MPSIKCGHCPSVHQSVEQVRQCAYKTDPATKVLHAGTEPEPVSLFQRDGRGTPVVASGHYAVTEGNELRFFKVDRVTEGKWAGRTFVKRQSSDELWPVKSRERREEILALIAAEPKEAMIRYGQEIGRCGHCNRTLTDETSRAAGIGPVCASRVWWAA